MSPNDALGRNGGGRFIRRLGLTIAALFTLAVLGCTTFQRKMIYVPRHESTATLDAAAQAHGIERWKNSVGENIGWRKAARHQPAKGQLLVTHGNGGCAIDRFDFAGPLSESGTLDIFILEYPGYGDRAGSPCEQEFFKAAAEAFRALPPNTPTYLLAESLGTGVAAYLAGKYSNAVAGVLLVAPYNRLIDVAQHHVKILPASWILTDRFPSDDYLRNYRGPVGILVGGRDQVVPAKFGRRLYEGYSGPKRLWEVPTGSHASITREPQEFWDAVVAFWRASENF